MSRDHLVTNRGAWETRHWITIPSITHEADGLQIARRLKQLPGVREVDVSASSHKIRITYDQTLIGFEQIQEKLAEIGFPASTSWWSRKKADWFQYLDTNARINAHAPPPPCCSNPKGLNTGKRKTSPRQH